MRPPHLLMALLVVTLSFVSGCSSGLTRIAQTTPESYQALGRTEGSACGSLGIAFTAYYFIPMGINSRVNRAYDNALHKVPGATGLIDVTLKEDWYWWLIGTARCVTISGEAIK